MKKNVISLLLVGSLAVGAEETLPPLTGGPAPQTVEELWAGFDPRAEPLEVEVLKEWEEDGVVLKVLRYRIGVFKGEKAMMAGVYGYPRGEKNLPGLVQLHGGGQYADYKACLTNARRGYATISVAWAGRINAPDYFVNPAIVKLFWEGQTNHPQYRVTTDWGALDGYHAPFRYKHGFSSSAPHDHTLDAVHSPRNDSWFLCTLGARRALTFLEQQPEVDAERLGVYGHSMGGKLTVMTAGSDDRVKAAAPSCGGISHRNEKDPLVRAAICDDAYLKQITCPVVFLSPANDFHGRIEDLQTAVREIRSPDWRATCAAHHQHQDTAEYEVATQLCFDQYLKTSFTWPNTPTHDLNLETPNGLPVFTVVPDASRKILSVDLYYTQHGDEQAADRFWHHVKAEPNGDSWSGALPVFRSDKPLWVYANVVYPLDQLVSGAGYYYGAYSTDTFNLSSLMSMVTPEQLASAGVKATRKPSLVLEDFQGDWEKEWYSYQPENWARTTRKVFDSQYAASDGARLALAARSAQPNRLVVGIDSYAAEIHLAGGPTFQPIVLSPGDFKNAGGQALNAWTGIKELRLGPKETLKAKSGGDVLELGGVWKGENPAFESLRWLPADE